MIGSLDLDEFLKSKGTGIISDPENVVANFCVPEMENFGHEFP